MPSDSLFASKNRSSANSTDQQQQQQQQQQSVVEDVSEHEDVFGPPPLPKASDAAKPKSKVASLFDDSDSGDDLFASASPSSRSQRSSERTPSRAAAPRKTRNLFDDEDDLFKPRDAPDVDLFGSARRGAEGLFDDVPPLDDVDEAGDDLFADVKPKSKGSSLVSSIFDGDDAESKDSEPVRTDAKKLEDTKSEKEKREEPEFKEPPPPLRRPKKLEERKKKSTRGLFDDSDDSDDSDLFGKPAVLTTASEKSAGLTKSLFEDTTDSDLFGSSSKNVLEKNIVVEKSTDSLFVDSSEPADLFSDKSTAKPQEEKVVKKNSPEDIFEGKSKLAKPKSAVSNIFDDSDDDEDLFGGSKKKSSTIFGDDAIVGASRKMDEEKKPEADKEPEEEKLPEKPSSAPKRPEKKSIFSDDEDDDDDDLFGDKKKKQEENKEKSSPEADAKPEAPKKPELTPKSALFAEMKQKLAKQIVIGEPEKNPAKPDGSPPPSASSSSSVVDGAVGSKREPPKSLKLQMGLPLPRDEASATGAAPRKLAVSNKIKNLMGKMEDLKILSPTDTPPLFRKNNEEKNGHDEDPEVRPDDGSSGPSTPSLASGASSPHTSGTNSRARDSPSLRSDNTEGAISFDEPAQVETLTSIASKSRARIQTKRRPQSRQARQLALRHSGIDFDAPDASTTSPTSDQMNGEANGEANGELQNGVDRLQLPRVSHADGRSNPAGDSGHADDRSELSVSRNTTTNLLSPSTDEEDLFDVPPELPEDPAAKEDSLFGRAPILSPIERIPEKKPRERARLSTKEDEDENDDETKEDGKHGKRKDEKSDEKVEPIDPLRDDSHDPLKDPSQLFAFVTKTPSPEKNKGLILSEDDDSLFSSSSKSNPKVAEAKPKPSLGLFDDDDDASGSDLFSSSKTKIEKKPLKDTKIDLFDDVDLEDDDDESLFGSVKKKAEKSESKEQSVAPSSVAEEKSEVKNIKSEAKDIFDDSSDGEDIFASSKKTIPKKKSKSLFDDDDDEDEDDTFGNSKSSVMKDSKTKVNNSRPVVKKAVTRDLKKTAEKIVEDPLSMLQDD